MADNPNPSEQDPGASREYAEEAFSSLLAESPELWEVVQRFARSLPSEVDSMIEALNAGACERLETIAARLKTDGAGHGYAGVTNRAATIEQAAHNHALDGLSAKIDELGELARQIHVAIDTLGA